MQKGLSLIEIILSVSILALFLAVLVGAIVFSQESQFAAGERGRANIVASEGLEALRNIRDERFSLLSDGSGLGLSTTSGRWNLSGSPDTVDESLTRSVGIESVGLYRKKISATTTWETPTGQVNTASVITYLTDWRRRLVWVAPTLEASFDLTVANSGNATANGLAIAYSHPYAYVARANSAGSEFYVFDVSNSAAPSLVGQLGLAGNPNDIAVLGNRAYIASSDNGSELQIIDVTTPSAPALAGSFDLTNANSGNGTADGISVAVSGTTVYFGRAASAGSEFMVFDATVPLAPLLLGTLGLSGDPNDMVVSGSNVFIASSDNASELQVISVAVPASPALSGSLNLDSGNANADGLSVSFGAANQLLLGRAASAAPEFYVIDISTPASPTLTGTLEIGFNVLSLGFATSTSYAFLASSDTANDFTSVDATSPAAPAVLGQLNLSDAPADLVYSPVLDRNFITGSSDTEELQIIAPQ
jgi:hypothetical protein